MSSEIRPCPECGYNPLDCECDLIEGKEIWLDPIRISINPHPYLYSNPCDNLLRELRRPTDEQLSSLDEQSLRDYPDLLEEPTDQAVELSLSIDSCQSDVTVDDLRDLIPTFLAWKDRLRREYQREREESDPIFDPIPIMISAHDNGMGPEAIARMLNKALFNTRETAKSGPPEQRRPAHISYMSFMKLLGIPVERALAYFEDDSPFERLKPLSKKWVKYRLEKRESKGVPNPRI